MVRILERNYIILIARKGFGFLIILGIIFLLLSGSSLAQPTPPVIGPITQPTCLAPTGSVVLNGLPKKGSWILRGDPGNIIIYGSGASYTVTGLLPGTYTFTVTNLTGTSRPSDKVVINPQPRPPDPPKAEVIEQPGCLIPTGTILVVYPEEGTGYEYSTGGAYQASSKFPDLLPGVYKVTVRRKEDITCISPAVELTINEQPPIPPPPTGSSPQSFCSIPAPTVSLLEATGTDIKWYITSSGGTALSPSTVLTTRNYYASQTINGCESSSRLEVMVVIITTPVINAGDDGQVCGALKYQLNATLNEGEGTWTKTSGPGTAVFSPDDHQPGATVTVSQTGAYVFKWTVVNGICSSDDEVQVIFYALPPVYAGPDTAVCRNGSVQLYAQGNGTFVWTPPQYLNNPYIHNPVASPVNTTTFRVTLTDGNGCKNSDEVKVLVRENPVADAGEGGEVCALSFKLGALAGQGYGTWSKISGPGDAVFTPDSHQPDALVTVSQSGMYDFLWTVTNGYCSSDNNVEVLFKSASVVNAGVDTAVCRSGSIKLFAQGNGTFLWSPPEFLSDRYIQDPVATPQYTTIFTVTMTDLNGCISTDDVKVSVRDIPYADAGEDQVLDLTSQTVLNANQLSPDESGSWSVIQGKGLFENPANPRTKVMDLSVGLNKFLWTVSNGVCQPANSFVNIMVNELMIPTFISPNGDPHNEYFILRGIGVLGKTGLTIMDRRGFEVYKNENYSNEWNGVDYNGNPLPDDTYFFILKPEKGKSISGYVVLRR